MNNFRLTDQRKKRISSVQSIPMKHCAELIRFLRWSVKANQLCTIHTDETLCRV